MNEQYDSDSDEADQREARRLREEAKLTGFEFDWVGPLTNDDGLITGREINHKTGETRPSFDIFDSDNWPGGIEEGKKIARMLEYTHNAFHGHEKKVKE